MIHPKRPAYVRADFAGKCKCFPESDKVLLPYQSRWARDNSRLKIAEKSRQIGWTWATAYGLVSRKSLRNARLDAWISSRDEIQARLFVEDCKNFAAVVNIGAVDKGECIVDDAGHSAYVLTFTNGLRIHSMSSNPDAQAGKRGDRILDEFALHSDPRRLYSIAFPGITWGGSLEIFSTHRGSQNYFNELINEVKHKGNPKGFSLHSVTLQDALDQGFLYKLQCKLPPDDERQRMDEGDYFDFIRSGCADEEAFQQEFCCKPADDTAAFLGYDLISSCEYAPGDDSQYRVERENGTLGTFDLAAAENPLHLGADIGRTKDLTVFWIIESVGDVEYTRHVVELFNKPFEEQEHILYELLALPAMRRACIDNTGIGRQFVERAQGRFGHYKVEAVTFSGKVKEQLAYPMRSAFENRTVRIPSDQFIRADLRAIRKESTASGNIRFTGERNASGHSDRFWALALAKHAASSATAAPGRIISFRPGAGSRFERQGRCCVGA